MCWCYVLVLCAGVMCWCYVLVLCVGVMCAVRVALTLLTYALHFGTVDAGEQAPTIVGCLLCLLSLVNWFRSCIHFSVLCTDHICTETAREVFPPSSHSYLHTCTPTKYANAHHAHMHTHTHTHTPHTHTHTHHLCTSHASMLTRTRPLPHTPVCRPSLLWSTRVYQSLLRSVCWLSWFSWPRTAWGR